MTLVIVLQLFQYELHVHAEPYNLDKASAVLVLPGL